MSKKRQLFIRFGHKYASSSKLAIHFVSRRGAKGDGSFWPLFEPRYAASVFVPEKGAKKNRPLWPPSAAFCNFAA